MNAIRAILRMIAFVAITMVLATRALILLWVTGRFEIIAGDFARWARLNLKVLGVDLTIKGQFPVEQVLIMPNHRSYLDVVAFPLQRLVVFVAKIEVSRWPVIGFGTRVVRTVLVDRNDPESRRNTRKEIQNRFDDGVSVVVFPEGTTAQAPEIKPFRPGMFFVAASGEIPIVPVAIEYGTPEDAFVGSATFVPHFIKTFGKRRTRMIVSFGPITRDTDGEKLREKVQGWVEAEAATLRQELGLPEEVSLHSNPV